MATVDGFSKDRSLQIEQQAVVDGEVDGAGNLTLIRNNGEEIDAGNIKGPVGPVGPPSMPTGAINMFGGAVAPTGFLLCDGGEYSRTAEAALFAVVGTMYGNGNGTTTFNVPNFKSKMPVGRDTSDTSFDTLGETGGEKTHVLTKDEMPSHTHIQDAHTHAQNAHTHTQQPHTHGIANGLGRGTAGNTQGLKTTPDTPVTNVTNTNSATAENNSTTATNQNTTATNQATGGDQAHNNMPPYVVVNYIIKT